MNKIFAVILFLIALPVAAYGYSVDWDKNLDYSIETGNTPHAGMWYNNKTGISATFNTTYQTFQFFDLTPSGHEHLVGFTYLGKGILRCDVPGEYHVLWEALGKGVQGHEYRGVIFINETMYNRTEWLAVGQASTIVSMHGVGFINIGKGSNVTLRIADTSGSATGTAYIGNVNLIRI